ncbi:DUF6167 family protein [Nocardioides sp.]|uniref:DUF6167 family protein n=1 Tax=Nocardioides sp. TaxID=35761 RepID=UPI002607353E|nr:DUF6167 family protein [Nocardioides sp.]
MKRSFWFVAGASAGVYAAARARRAAEILTVDGLRDRIGAVVVGARMFRDEVAQGKAEAETDLRERITLGLHERRELMAGTDPGTAGHDAFTEPTDEEEGTS